MKKESKYVFLLLFFILMLIWPAILLCGKTVIELFTTTDATARYIAIAAERTSRLNAKLTGAVASSAAPVAAPERPDNIDATSAEPGLTLTPDNLAASVAATVSEPPSQTNQSTSDAPAKSSAADNDSQSIPLTAAAPTANNQQAGSPDGNPAQDSSGGPSQAASLATAAANGPQQKQSQDQSSQRQTRSPDQEITSVASASDDPRQPLPPDSMGKSPSPATQTNALSGPQSPPAVSTGLNTTDSAASLSAASTSTPALSKKKKTASIARAERSIAPNAWRTGRLSQKPLAPDAQAHASLDEQTSSDPEGQTRSPLTARTTSSTAQRTPNTANADAEPIARSEPGHSKINTSLRKQTHSAAARVHKWEDVLYYSMFAAYGLIPLATILAFLFFDYRARIKQQEERLQAARRARWPYTKGMA